MSDKFTGMLESLTKQAKGALAKGKGRVEKTMSLEKFQAYAKDELADAIKEQDESRIEALQQNIESVGKQLEDDPDAEVVKVSVTRDPAQHRNEGDFTESTRKLTDAVEKLTEVVTDLKKAKPFGEDDDEGKGKKADEEEEKEKERRLKAKAKQEEMEEEEDKEESKRRKAAGLPDESDEEKDKRRADQKEEDKKEAKRRKENGEDEESDDEKRKRRAKSRDAEIAKLKKSNDDVRWPSDMNTGRSRTDTEKWGQVNKSDGGNDYRSFGDDPPELRGS